jgi:putative transposase
MHYRDSILAQLLKPISRRWFRGRADALGADAYDKGFRSWDHLVTLVYAQLGSVGSLRGIEAVWNANAHHRYHLGVGKLARSTLSDANARRPVAIFAETFAFLSGLADKTLRREGAEMLRLIDATPIPLHRIVGWAKWNGRTRGLKLHVVYDPHADHPRSIDITPANVHDVVAGRAVPIETGATYAFDKAYCDYAWWTRLDGAGALFVTRPKTNARYEVVRRRPLERKVGEGFKIIDDTDVRLATQGNKKLAIPMRRVRVRRDEDGSMLSIVTNDRRRSAIAIATIYKTRWQIELLFRWLKQHLKIVRFIGRTENAIQLQIVAAMIAYLLLRIASRQSRVAMSAIRFAELAGEFLFTRKPIARIDKPPEVNPSTARPRQSPDQLQLCYA